MTLMLTFLIFMYINYIKGIIEKSEASYTWQGFNDMLKAFPLVTPKIYVSIYDK